MRPVIAVIGSLNTERVYERPLVKPELGRQACVELGRELAAAGCDLAVYDSRPAYIERDVVAGYVASGLAQERSIHVHLPFGKAITFPEMDRQPELFAPQPMPAHSWHLPFYQSLLDVAGILLVGGGRSTVICGTVALTFGTPLVVAAQFGGAAAEVWPELRHSRTDLSESEAGLMAVEWTDTSAQGLAASLLTQIQRRAARAAADSDQRRREVRRGQLGLLSAAVLLVAALAVIPAAWAARPGSGGSLALLLAAPALAAISGALIRNSYDDGKDWITAGVRGLAAGVMAFLLFVATQLAGTPDLFEGTGGRRLLFYVLPIGFVAGLTFDAVYARLRATDVTDTTSISRR